MNAGDTFGAGQSPRETLNLSANDGARWDAETRETQVEPAGVDGLARAASLVVTAGPGMGRVFSLSQARCTVGRSDEAALVIRDESISRVHAALFADAEGRYRIRDLESTNGTFVNGARVTESPVETLDSVQLGKHTMVRLVLHSTSLQSLTDELYQLGTHDLTTGTFNRPYFAERLISDYRLAARHREPLSVMLVGIDRRGDGEPLGPVAVDTAMRAAASRVASRIRGSDVLARHADRELAVLLRQTDATGARILAMDLCRLVAAAPVALDTVELALNAVIGVATLLPGGAPSDADLLIASASAALAQSRQPANEAIVILVVGGEAELPQ
ncbi:MAG: FHA domain-containing protein [Deltaproteobacteria bacterium]|nr:FHA domain-containing protein [Deltaproteobacteria bacterium]